MFKKITTLLLASAFMLALVMPATLAPPRTVKKETVKSEIYVKIVKTDIAKENQVTLIAAEMQTDNLFNPLAIAELNRPPGVILAKATYARANRYKQNDALIKPDKNCKQLLKPTNWRS